MPAVERRNNKWQLIAFLDYDELGKQRRKKKTIDAIGVSKAEAMRRASAFEKEYLEQAPSTQAEKMTFNEFLAYWKENYGDHLAINTVRRNNELLQRISALIGHIKLGKLSVKHIHLFIKRLQDPNARKDGKGPLSSRTINMHFKLLSSILNRAVKWQFLKDNPCSHVDAPKQKTKPTPILQEQDLAKFIHLLITKAPLKYQAFFMLGLTDGLRRSEILGLDESAFDFKNGTVTIKRTAVINLDNEVVYKDDTKTEQSATIMYLSPTVSDIVQRYMEERKSIEKEYDLPHVTQLFTDIRGKPNNPQRFTRWLGEFCEEHELPKITTQSMRKMAITYVLGAVNMKEASLFGRHSNIDTTARYYAEVLNSRMVTPTMYLDKIVKTAIDTNGEKI